MSKEKKDYGEQVKPKCKIKVTLNGEEKILNEYDLAAMMSDLNFRMVEQAKVVQELSEALRGLLEGMKSATTQNEGVNGGTKVDYTSLNIPNVTENGTLEI